MRRSPGCFLSSTRIPANSHAPRLTLASRPTWPCGAPWTTCGSGRPSSDATPEPEPTPPTTLVVDAFPTEAPAAPPAGGPERAPRGATFVPALAEGVRVVLARPRVLLFLLLCSILLPLVAVLPVYESVQTHLAAATPGPNEGTADFLDGAPKWMLDEWAQRDPLGATGGGHALMPLILFSSLFGLVVSAGWMSFVARDRRDRLVLVPGNGRHRVPSQADKGRQVPPEPKRASDRGGLDPRAWPS